MSAFRSSGVRFNPNRCPGTARVLVPWGPFQPVGTYSAPSRRGSNQSYSVATDPLCSNGPRYHTPFSDGVL
jgi:hypothetical protein